MGTGVGQIQSTTPLFGPSYKLHAWQNSNVCSVVGFFYHQIKPHAKGNWELYNNNLRLLISPRGDEFVCLQEYLT